MTHLPVFKGLRTFLILLSCLHLCAGGTGLFQILAWSRMLVDYSASVGIAEGVAMTFDGQHPCGLCKAITEQSRQKKDNEKGSPALAAMKFALGNLILSRAAETFQPGSVEFVLPDFVDTKSGNSIPTAGPPVPPPRELRA